MIVIRVTEGENFKFTCMIACGSKAEWKIRMQKNNQAIYFPKRKHSFSQLPKHTTEEFTNIKQCYLCYNHGINLYQYTISELVLNNIHKDLNESIIYCGQITSTGTILVQHPFKLLVYNTNTPEFDRKFHLPSRATINIKKNEETKPAHYIDNLLKELKSGNVKLQLAMYLLCLVFNIILFIILYAVISIDIEVCCVIITIS